MRKDHLAEKSQQFLEESEIDTFTSITKVASQNGMTTSTLILKWLK